MSQKRLINLLELPPEILAQILGPFLTVRPGTSILLLDPGIANSSRKREAQRRRNDNDAEDDEGTTLGPSSVFFDSVQVLNILLIHPITYALSIPILYSPNHVFVLDTTGRNHAGAKDMFADLRTESENALEPIHDLVTDGNILKNWIFLRNINSLRLNIDRLRGWMPELIIPFLQRMILRGSLKHLHVHIDMPQRTDSRRTPSKSGWAAIAEKLAEGQPLRSFVELLRDPDLAIARMTVSAEHDEAWCEYHGDRGMSSCQHSGLVEAHPTDGVDVEWWRLPLREAPQAD